MQGAAVAGGGRGVRSGLLRRLLPASAEPDLPLSRAERNELEALQTMASKLAQATAELALALGEATAERSDTAEEAAGLETRLARVAEENMKLQLEAATFELEQGDRPERHGESNGFFELLIAFTLAFWFWFLTR
jgi:hypothetical protein